MTINWRHILTIGPRFLVHLIIIICQVIEMVLIWIPSQKVSLDKVIFVLSVLKEKLESKDDIFKSLKEIWRLT